MLLHDELVDLLPPAVYTALDATTGMAGDKRIKYQDQCRKSAHVLDNCIAAPFHHMTHLALDEDAPFCPLKRGQAFAGAGRSAAARTTAVAHFADNVTRDSFLRAQVTVWKDIRHEFSASHELSSSTVDRLWGAAFFVFSHRVARSASWGVEEVAEACKKQFDDLPAYRTAIASALARSAAAHTGEAAARSINRGYAQFFLPFWTEHILSQGPLEPADHKAAAEELLKPPPPPPYVPPAAPPAYAPPALPAPHLPPHLLPPPPYPFYPHHLPFGPPPGLPPFQAPPPPFGSPPPNPAPGQQRPQQGGFLGKPMSPLIIGNKLGIAITDGARPCSCTITRAFPGRVHYPFECPLRYHAQRGTCPGWTSYGTRIPTAWAGEDITPATQAEWRAMVPSLATARAAGGKDAQF
jgi:hypothetical protein